MSLGASAVKTFGLKEDFAQGLGERWVVEQCPGGQVRAAEGVLEIQDKGGCTVWFKQKLKAPVRIRFRVTMVSKGGPFDRVSDLNCFWMATNPASPADLFKAGHGRDGRFATYDSLRTYYVGCGGNTNTSTRFRRYAGNGERPLLPEHDLSSKDVLLEGNKEYFIELSADGEWIEYKRDGKILFRWKDPAPLTEGWFGFRTVLSHQRIRDIEISGGL